MSPGHYFVWGGDKEDLSEMTSELRPEGKQMNGCRGRQVQSQEGLLRLCDCR